MSGFVFPHQDVVMNHKTTEGLAALFSSASGITAMISALVLTVFSLLRILFTSLSPQLFSPLTFLYYIMGIEKVTSANIIVMSFIFSFLALFTLSIIYTFTASRFKNKDRLITALNLTKLSLIYAMILTIMLIIISFCSVSVMHQADMIADQYGKLSPDTSFAVVNGMNSGALFGATCFNGTLIICVIIGFMYFVNSVKNSIKGDTYKRSGSGFSLFVSVISSVIFFFNFFSCLRELIMPDQIGTEISFSYVGETGCDTVIFASLCVFSFCLIFIIKGYRSVLRSASKAAVCSFYIPNGNPGQSPANNPTDNKFN